MAPDTMRVRLHLRLIRVLAVLVDTTQPARGRGGLDQVVVALSALRVQDANGA